MHNYIFCIDTIKVVSLVQHILKDGHLHNVTIDGHKFKNMFVYKCGRKFKQSLFKEYQDAVPEEEGSTEFATFHDIVNLLTVRGESKVGLSTYYINLCHGKSFDHILDRIGQMDLNGISSIETIDFSKSLKENGTITINS